MKGLNDCPHNYKFVNLNWRLYTENKKQLCKSPRPRINRPRMPNFLVGLLNAVQAIEILWFKNLNSWSLLLTMRQGTQHSKNIVFKSKIYPIYEILIGSWKKAKVSCTGRPTSARSIYSWSRVSHLEPENKSNCCSMGTKYSVWWKLIPAQWVQVCLFSLVEHMVNPDT